MLGVAISFGTLDTDASSTNFEKYGWDYSVVHSTGIDLYLGFRENNPHST